MKNNIVYLIIGVLLAAVVMGGIFFFTVNRNADNQAVKAVPTYKHSLDEFTTNLGSVRNYFKGTVVLETTNKDMLSEFQAKNAEIRDAIIQILISKKPEDILDTTGQQELRNEIKDALAELLKTDEIKGIYFIDYMIQ